MIGDDIEVTILDFRGDKVCLGINNPKQVSVHRREIYDAIQKEKKEKTMEARDVNPAKSSKDTYFNCSGAYGGIAEQEAYIQVSPSEIKLKCDNLNIGGYCSFGNHPTLKKCPFVIEKLV